MKYKTRSERKENIQDTQKPIEMNNEMTTSSVYTDLLIINNIIANNKISISPHRQTNR